MESNGLSILSFGMDSYKRMMPTVNQFDWLLCLLIANWNCAFQSMMPLVEGKDEGEE